MSKAAAQALIREYASEYIEKVFYFCLRRCGSADEAEDVAGDIGYDVVTALSKGNVPRNFRAWVWRIARNRCSRWACARKAHVNMTAEGIAELIQSEDCGIDDALIYNEQLSLLRRELSFVAKDCREILIAYYIDDRRTEDIAKSLNLPKGTVVSKLCRIRKKLKEGMNMSREFGEKSYRPENVFFAATGNQPSGLPWTAVSRLIPKNLLLEAHNNPSTSEELAIALGIALPYAEEEIELLVKATLLKRVGDRYITNFFIEDKEYQRRIYQALRAGSKQRTELALKISRDMLPTLRISGAVRNNACDTELLWFLLIFIMDIAIRSSSRYSLDHRQERNDGGNWGFVGYEENDIEESTTLSHNGGGSYPNMLWAYELYKYNLTGRIAGLHYEDIVLLADIIKNHRPLSSLSKPERRTWEKLDGRFAHSEGDSIIPDILVFEDDAIERLEAAVSSHILYPELSAAIESAFNEVTSALEENSNPAIEEQFDFYATMDMFAIRMMSVNDAVEAGELIVPDNPGQSKTAIWLIVK